MISNDCCICFEQIYDPIYLNCNKFNDHCLCKECYINYIKHCIKCPICRLPIKNIKISIFNFYQLNKLFFFILDIVGYSVGLFIMGVFFKQL